MNRHRLASDPDTTFHFDGDPGPDAIASFTHVVKSEFFYYFYSQECSFSSAKKVHIFPKWDSILKFSGKSIV